MAEPSISLKSLIERFGPHPAYTPPGGWQDESRNPAYSSRSAAIK